MRIMAEKTDRKSRWISELQKRSCANMAAVALAAKHARNMWAMLVHGTKYKVQGWPLEGKAEKGLRVFDGEQRKCPTNDCGQDGLKMNGVGLTQASA